MNNQFFWGSFLFIWIKMDWKKINNVLLGILWRHDSIWRQHIYWRRSAGWKIDISSIHVFYYKGQFVHLRFLSKLLYLTRADNFCVFNLGIKYFIDICCRFNSSVISRDGFSYICHNTYALNSFAIITLSINTFAISNTCNCGNCIYDKYNWA